MAITSALTLIMVIIGRSTLGEGAIALLYLIPIGFCTFRWGRLAGASASITAAISFDYFFIPPFYTFIVGSIESWFILAIFLVAAIIIVGNLQSLISTSKERERRTTFLYELVTTLANLRTRQAVARLIASHIHQWFQTEHVQVKVYETNHLPSTLVNVPSYSQKSHPDLVLPVVSGSDMLGSISIWKGHAPLLPLDDRLTQFLLLQTSLALIRVQRIEENDSITRKSAGENKLAEI
jgi:K+-sensing histidine kinase KdpD